MFSFVTSASPARRTLFFGSAMHVWSDLYFALMIPLLPFIKDDLGLSFKQVAVLRSLFTGASAVLQIPAGFLAEIVGEFWPLVWGNVWVAVGLVGMAFSPILAVLLVASFLGGLGGGTQHPLASSMVSRAYDERGRSTAVGTVNFSGDLGKMVAPIVGGLIAINLGWRAALWIVGAAGVVFMALSTTVRRSVDIDKPRAEVPVGTGEPGLNAGVSLMGGFIVLSGVGFLDSAVRGGSLVFLPFVMTDKDMSATQVSTMLVLLFAGGAAGKFVCGWLGERHGIVSLIWGTKGLTALLLGLSLLTPPVVMAPLMVVLGIGLNGTSSVLYATVAEFVPPRRRARLYGVYYTTNEGGTVAAPLLFAVIADSFGLRIATMSMSLATAAILPASLALRKYTNPKTVASHTTDE